MSDGHIVTIEFEADNRDQLGDLVRELQRTYPIAAQTDQGVRINGWSRDPLPDSEDALRADNKRLREALGNISSECPSCARYDYENSSVINQALQGDKP